MAVTVRGPARTQIRRVRRVAPRRDRRSPQPPLPPRGLLLAAPLALALVLLVVFQALYLGRVYPGVRALGVELGGLTREEAEARLADRAGEVAATTLTLRLGDQQWRTSAADLGVRLDPLPLAEAAYQVGREGSPPERLVAQLRSLLGGTEVAWTSAGPDTAALARFLRGIAAAVDRPVEEAHLAITPDYTLDYRPGQAGRTLDLQALEPRARELLLEGGELDLGPFVRTTEPKTTEAQLADARALAERVLASPLVLRFQDHEWVVDRPTLARMLSFRNQSGGRWTAELDDRPLRDRLGQIAAEIDQEPQDARLSWDGGALGVIRESREGRHLDQEAALAAALQALRSDNHVVELPVEVARPAVDMRDVANMGIVELIESAQTSFAGSIPEKQHNIRLAAERLNGVVVPPGGLFSFNKEVGPTTLDAGFQWGYGLESSSSGVKTVPSVAGGICQVATTLFQPVFWAGYQIEERNWHLYWIPAYTSREMPGLDATVDEASGLDFKFINNTSTYLLIQSWTTDSTVHFALYGTRPDWTVEVDKPVVTNERKADPKPVYEERPDMPWGWRLQVSAARDGFDVLIVRRVIRGNDVRTLKLSSTYQPSQNVTMIGTKGKPADVPIDGLLTPSPTPKPVATPAPAATKAAEREAEATPTAAPAVDPVGQEGVVQGGATEEGATSPAPTPTPKPKAKKSQGKAKPTSTAED